MEDENENGATFTYSIDPKSIRIIRIQKSVESDWQWSMAPTTMNCRIRRSTDVQTKHDPRHAEPAHE
jgi:hypothetical protein